MEARKSTKIKLKYLEGGINHVKIRKGIARGS